MQIKMIYFLGIKYHIQILYCLVNFQIATYEQFYRWFGNGFEKTIYYNYKGILSKTGINKRNENIDKQPSIIKGKGIFVDYNKPYDLI